MQFKTVEGEFRLRLQRREGNKWRAVGWPVQDELRYVIEQNPEIVKNLGHLFPLEGLTDQQLAQAGLNRDEDNVLSRFIEECDRSFKLSTQLSQVAEALEEIDRRCSLPAVAEAYTDSTTCTRVRFALELVGRAWWKVDDPVIDEETKPPTFGQELESLINRYSMERGSDTPDFLLAEYLKGCLEIYDKTVCAREEWYGRKPVKSPVAAMGSLEGGVLGTGTVSFTGSSGVVDNG